MKFYEIKDPCFTLIVAGDEKQCLKLYKDIVCGVEDEKEFFDDMKTIDKYEASKMLTKSHIEDNGELGVEEAFDQLENLEEDDKVLLIDGSLIWEEQSLFTTLKIYKGDFNESIKTGELIDYAGDKHIVIHILKIKKLCFSKSVRLEPRILVREVGITTNYNKYRKQAQVVEHYDQSRENEGMKEIGDIVILDKKIAHEVISTNSTHCEFVDLVVEYTVQVVVLWLEQEINKAPKEEHKSTFRVLEGGK